jgi:SAM-dependent methyltransferase
MAHKAQYEYVLNLRDKFPSDFRGVDSLCIGSLDINSTSRGMRLDLLFTNSSHIGLDLGEGPGVDIVCSGHLYNPPRKFDTVYSCECFEHNKYWVETILNMTKLTRPGGLMFFTCATEGRMEHGTVRFDTDSSPFTTDYYRNITESDVLCEVPEFTTMFDSYEFSIHEGHRDLQFWGRIKN